MTKMLTLDKAALFRYLGYEPRPSQLEIHLSKTPRRVVACGVRWGKTRVCIWETVAALLVPGCDSLGWIVGPNLDVVDLTFREVRSVFEAKLPHRLISVDERARHLVVRNLSGGLSEVRGKSAVDPACLLGEGLDWLVVDEAARLKRSVWEEHLVQRLTDRQGWALLTSVPGGHDHWFHELHERGTSGTPDYQSWRHPSWENPRLDPAVIEREREALPDAVFHTQYGAEFLGADGPQCLRCGAPSRMARGCVVLFGDDVVEYCSDCGRPVTAEGAPLGWPDGEGRVRLVAVRVHRPQRAIRV